MRVARETSYSLKYVMDKWLGCVEKNRKIKTKLKIIISRNAHRMKKMTINNWKIYSFGYR